VLPPRFYRRMTAYAPTMQKKIISYDEHDAK
jgi:hypothetical protein